MMNITQSDFNTANNMKNIRYIVLLMLSCSILASCQQVFKESWPEMKLERKSLTLKAASSKAPFNILYDGAWNVEVTAGNWFSVSPSSGSGVATIHLLYDENTGLSRAGEITITAGDGTSFVIPVKQSAGVALPQIVMPKEKCLTTAEEGEKILEVNSNIPQKYISETSPVIEYEGESKDWIHDFGFLPKEEPLTGDELAAMPDGTKRFAKFKVDENTSGADRSATITLTLVDASDTRYSATATITQTAEGAFIRIPESVTVFREKTSKAVNIETNLEDYISEFALTVEYPDPEADGFLSKAAIEGGKLVFTIDENGSGKERSAKIKLTYDSVSATMTITQLASSLNFKDFIINNKEDFDTWADNSTKWTAEDVITLKCDVDANRDWKPANFRGKFDGGKHTISRLRVSTDGNAGIVDTLSGVISNLIIDASCTIKSTGASAGAVAFACYADGSAKLSGIVSSASISMVTGSSNSHFAGAMIGQCISPDVEIENCVNNGDIVVSGKNSNLYLGGILGYDKSNGISIVNCTNTGAVTNSGATASARIGGIAGDIGSSTSATYTALVSGCTNNGTVSNSGTTSTDTMVGGIVGMLAARNITNAVKIEKCTNNGLVTSPAGGKAIRIGGLVGDGAANGTLDGCFSNADVKVGTNKYSTEVRISAMLGSNTNKAFKISNCRAVGVTVSNANATPKLYISAGISFTDGTASASATVEGCTIYANLVDTGGATTTYNKMVLPYAPNSLGGKVRNCYIGGSNLGEVLTVDNLSLNLVFKNNSAVIENCQLYTE